MHGSELFDSSSVAWPLGGRVVNDEVAVDEEISDV